MAREAVPPSSTFRIFVSSTFSDLKAERDALQRYVFPRLRELCASRGGRFQAIDLRWGVSEEAGLDQRTMSICLGEIERCQRTTPRPNFVVLLGEHYGWRALLAEIPAEQLERIRAQVTDAQDEALLEAWYRLDENAAPPVYCLQPRRLEIAETASQEAREAAQDAEATKWTATESSLRKILLDAVAALGLGEEARLEYEASATEQEIERGALRVPDAAEHVFCFLRSITNLDELVRDIPPEKVERQDDRPLAEDFVDLIDPISDRRLDEEARERLAQLKEEKLRWLLGKNVHDYEATWSGGSVGEDHLGSLPDSLDDSLALLDDSQARGTLCLDVWRSLATTILGQLEQVERIDPVSAEIWAHEEFGRERSGHFTGREQPLAHIAQYLAEGEQDLFAIVGEPGSGKSALMAKALERARADHPGAVTLVRFIGATPASSDGRALLDSLCREISRAYQADESDVPSEYNDLAVELGKRMELASADRPLVLFVDALDQLSGVARGLSWLPGALPEHVRVVLSTLPGDCEQALRAKHPAPELVPLEAMSPEEGKELVGRWLEQAGRTLQEHQEEEVLAKFASEGLPLYLRLAFEEARLWRSYAEPEETVLGEGIPALIRENLFARLAQPANHGRVMVAHSLGYLAASRFGLSEDEIIDVLSLDDEVKRDFREHARRSPEIERLPIVVWSRLYFDLAPYLSERSAEGTTLLAFYHNQLREAANAEYLAGEHGPRRHTALAGHFRGRSDPQDDRHLDGRLRPRPERAPLPPRRGRRAGPALRDPDRLQVPRAQGCRGRSRRAQRRRGQPDHDLHRCFPAPGRLRARPRQARRRLEHRQEAPDRHRRRPRRGNGDPLPLVRQARAFPGGVARQRHRLPKPGVHRAAAREHVCRRRVAARAGAVKAVQSTPNTETDDRRTTLEAFARALRREMALGIAVWASLATLWLKPFGA